LPGYWFKIAGIPVWKDRPMRTGADGIALSADRTTLYWCPLTARNLYAIDTALLHDFSIPQDVIANSVQNLGDKGTNTDGLGADNKGLIYYTMLENQGIGIYDPTEKTFRDFISDPRMIWVDGMTFDNQGSLIFDSNRLHELFGGDLDWNYPYNLVIWKAWLGEDVKSYTHHFSG
jgi:sugar lactone lactonase YvrE